VNEPPARTPVPSSLLASELDAADPLKGWRTRFALPLDQSGRPLIYLCGHSLGLAPVGARARVLEELEDWERLGVLGHERARRPWIGCGEPLAPGLALLAGAEPSEVVAMNSLTVNLHLLLASFYRPEGSRYRILIEAGAFPSDRFALESQIRWHGYDPATALIELRPRPGEDLLRAEDIDARLAADGASLALVLWPGVQYRTGQAFDVAQLVRAAHRVGAAVGFDLAHAIGNVPLALHDTDADFAVWCSYKYLNGGPGAIGGAFVHARHARVAQLPRLAGWWGGNPDTRFEMSDRLELSAGAAGWQVSNPPVLSAAPLYESLQMFSSVGLAALRAKSELLTGFLHDALLRCCREKIEVITGPDPQGRGCQLSIRIRSGMARARAVHVGLGERRVIADWREPDTIRLAPVPFYNSFTDAWYAAEQVAAALGEP
jgi:kynureninase